MASGTFPVTAQPFGGSHAIALPPRAPMFARSLLRTEIAQAALACSERQEFMRCSGDFVDSEISELSRCLPAVSAVRAVAHAAASRLGSRTASRLCAQVWFAPASGSTARRLCFFRRAAATRTRRRSTTAYARCCGSRRLPLSDI